MKNRITKLYVFMILGILLSFIILFTGGGYYGMANSNEAAITLVIASVIIFFISINILRKNFHQYKANIALWLLILISAPLTALGSMYLIQKSIYSVRSARYTSHVRNTDMGEYQNAKMELNTFIENNIDWSIEDLGIENDIYKIEFSTLDTMFFSPNVSGEIAGLLVIKQTTNDVFLDSLQENGDLRMEEVQDIKNAVIENKYLGLRFIYNRDLDNMDFYSNDMYAYPTVEDCINVLRESYLSGDDYYHMNTNSVNFWDYQDDTRKQRYYSLLF